MLLSDQYASWKPNVRSQTGSGFAGSSTVVDEMPACSALLVHILQEADCCQETPWCRNMVWAAQLIEKMDRLVIIWGSFCFHRQMIDVNILAKGWQITAVVWQKIRTRSEERNVFFWFVNSATLYFYELLLFITIWKIYKKKKLSSNLSCCF